MIALDLQYTPLVSLKTSRKNVAALLLVMCDTYMYRCIDISIFSVNIALQNWLLGVSIHKCAQFSKPGFSNLLNFIPKSNYNKLASITLIDFFLPFLDNYNQTGHLFTFYKYFNYFFEYCDTVLNREQNTILFFCHIRYHTFLIAISKD